MPSLTLPSDLVSVQWLAEHCQHSDLILLDTSWHMPMTQRDGYFFLILIVKFVINKALCRI